MPTKGSLTLTKSDFIYTLSPGQTADDQFEIVATADGKESKPAVFKILPSLIGDKPVADAVSASCTEDEACRVVLSAKSGTANQGFFFQITKQPRNLTASLNIVTGEVTLQPKENFNGQDSFTYRAQSGDRWSTEVIVPIAVSAVNDRPVFVLKDSSQGSTTMDEDSSKVFEYDLTDVEISEIADMPVSLVASASPAHGTVIIDQDRKTFTYRPNDNFNGTDSFSIHSCEKNSNPEFCSVPITVNLSISPVNDAPYANEANLSLTEDDGVAGCLDMSLFYGDVDNQNQDVRFAIDSTQNQAGISVNGNRFCFAPPANFNGEFSVSYSVEDPAGLRASNQIKIAVAGQEDPTEFDLASLKCVLNEDTTGTCTIRALDADGPVHYSMNYNELLRKRWGVYLSDAFVSDGTFRVEPPSNYYGKMRIPVSASAGGSFVDTELEIEVTNVYDRPTWTTLPAATVISLDSNSVSLVFNATSPDQRAITYPEVSNPLPNGCSMTNVSTNDNQLSLRFSCTIVPATIQYTVSASDGITTVQNNGTVAIGRSNPTTTGIYWQLAYGKYVTNASGINSISDCLTYSVQSGARNLNVIYSTNLESNFDYLKIYAVTAAQSQLLHEVTGTVPQTSRSLSLPSGSNQVRMCLYKDSSVSKDNPEVSIHSVLIN
jgi:hypothetical protein